MSEVMLVIEAVKVLNQAAENFEELRKGIAEIENTINENDGEVPDDLIEQITQDRKDAVDKFNDNLED